MRCDVVCWCLVVCCGVLDGVLWYDVRRCDLLQLHAAPHLCLQHALPLLQRVLPLRTTARLSIQHRTPTARHTLAALHLQIAPNVRVQLLQRR